MSYYFKAGYEIYSLLKTRSWLPLWLIAIAYEKGFPSTKAEKMMKFLLLKTIRPLGWLSFHDP